MILKIIILILLAGLGTLYYFYGGRKTLRIAGISLLSFFGLILLLVILVHFTAIQNFLVREASSRLSAKLGTEVSIGQVRFGFFDRMVLQDALVKDRHQDTLLYAGLISVRITDFFFLKKRPVLHYARLDHARINLTRTAKSPVWNYQFLLDALSAPSSRSDTGKNGMDLDIRQLDLADFVLRKTDNWEGSNMVLSLFRLHLDARSLDLKRKTLRVNQIQVQSPSFSLIHESSSVPGRGSAIPAPAPGEGFTLNPGNWHLFVKQVSVKNGNFFLKSDSLSPTRGYFDPGDIRLTAVNATLTDTRVVRDSLLTRLELSAKEGSGLVIRKLSARFKFSPVEMEFADLDLRTNRSDLRNYFAMHYRSLSGLGDFLHQVSLVAHIQGSTVSSDDLAIFAPTLSGWNMNFQVRGEIRGTIANLNARNLDLRSRSSHLQGDLQINGLPDLNDTYIDFSANQLNTGSRDLEKFLPRLKQKAGFNLDSLTDIRFRGNFTGFLQDFVAFGTFHTNLGDMTCDLNFKKPRGSSLPSYSGNLSTSELDLGTLLGMPYLGKATLQARIDGQGLRMDRLRAKLNSNIDEITLNGYPYHNIKTNGEFAKKKFDGLLISQDPNLGLLFQGKIDFSDSLPTFNFNATVTHSDLLALKLTRDSMNFSGQLDLDFAGNNIDNFLGTARLYHINLYKNRNRVAFDSLYVNTSISGVTKTLTLKGNEIDGYIKGIYDIRDLPGAVQYFLSDYYPSLIHPPAHYIPDEKFSFALNLGNVDSLLRTFTTGVYGFNQSQISGDLDARGQQLDVLASVPSAGIGKYRLDNTVLKGNGTRARFGIQVSIKSIFSSDSLLFPNTSLLMSSTRDSSFIELKTRATNTLNEADLAARVITSNNGYDVSILNSQIVINDKTWKIPADNDFFISKDAFRVRNFTITNNDQRIVLSSGTPPSDSSGTRPDLELRLTNLNINDFAVLAKLPFRLEGIADGNIQVLDPLGHFQVNGEIQARELRIENDSIGNFRVTGGYDQGLLQVHAAILDATKSFAADGTIGLTSTANQVQMALRMQAFKPDLLNTFLTDFLSNLSGSVSGQLAVTGTRSAPQVEGLLTLDTLGMVVKYTNTYYNIPKAAIHFTGNTIDLGTILLHDPNHNTASITGTITHDHFNSFRFNCNLTTEKFQMLNTDEDDNSLFYGTVFASGRINFYGPVNDLQMDLNLTPIQNTHLYLPLSTGTDVGKHDFIVFKSYGTKLKGTSSSRSRNNLTVRLNALMNSHAAIDVILDQATGDEITATGSGNIKMDFSLNGGLSLYGTYTIDDGNYTFIYQRLIAKKFKISQGSTISWNGSPYTARVKVNAIYSVPGGASLYDLISGDVETSNGFLTEEDRNLAERKEKVDVYLILTGMLLKPDIHFDIRLPDQGIAVTSYAMTRLEQVKQDPSEMTQEVAWLLLFNQFYPVTPSSSNSNLLRSGGLTSVGQFLSSTASTQLNSLLGRVIKNNTVGLNVNYDAYSASGEAGDPLARNEVQVGVTKSLANNRIRLEAGPSVDWGRTSYVNNQYSSSSAFAGDFQFEYLITPDGRVRATVFRRSSYDVLLNGNLSVFGATLTYKRDFDHFADLFSPRRIRQQNDSLERASLERMREKQDKQDSLMRK